MQEVASLRERLTPSPLHVSVLFRSRERNATLADTLGHLTSDQGAFGVNVLPVFLDPIKNMIHVPEDDRICVPHELGDVLPEVVAHSLTGRSGTTSIRGMDVSGVRQFMVVGLPDDIDQIAEQLPGHLGNGLGSLKGKITLCKIAVSFGQHQVDYIGFRILLTPKWEDVRKLLLEQRAA